MMSKSKVALETTGTEQNFTNLIYQRLMSHKH